MKDWTENKNSIFKTLGASNHTYAQRELNDYYATEPKAGELLLELEDFNHIIWECACGEGHLSKVFEKAGHKVWSTDLIDRGYGIGGVDFLKYEPKEKLKMDIITNPPYKCFSNDTECYTKDGWKKGFKGNTIIKWIN